MIMIQITINKLNRTCLKYDIESKILPIFYYVQLLIEVNLNEYLICVNK